MNDYIMLLHLEDKLKKQRVMEEYLTQGIENTRWGGTKAGYVDLLRKGLKVTEIEITGTEPADMWFKYEQDLGEALHNHRYRKNKRDNLEIRFMDVIMYSNKIIRLLIIPKEMNGFSLRDRLHYLDEDMYNYLKGKNLVH